MRNRTRSIALIAGLTALIGCAVYPVIIHPKLFPEKYSGCLHNTLIFFVNPCILSRRVDADMVLQ